MTKRVKNVLGVLLGLLICSMIVNIVYAYNMKIDEPIFVTKYEQIDVNEDQSQDFRIEYIKDNRDIRNLVAVEFEGLEEAFHVYNNYQAWSFFENNNQNQVGKGRYYTLCNQYIEFDFNNELIKKVDEIGQLRLTDAKLFFDDQTTLDVNIGEVIFRRYNKDKIIRPRSGSGGDFNYEVSLQVTEPIFLTGIDFSTFIPHKDDVLITLVLDSSNEYDYEALVKLTAPVKVNSHIKVKYDSVNNNRNQMWRFGNISLGIHYEKDGEKGVFNVPYIFNGGQMEDESVEAYVKMWRAFNE